MKSRGHQFKYFPLAAMAVHGKMASAASTERFFRAVAFVNSLQRMRQEPETIARLSYLNRNSDFMPTAQRILALYKERVQRFKRTGQREDRGAKAAVSLDDDDDDGAGHGHTCRTACDRREFAARARGVAGGSRPVIRHGKG